MESETKEAKGKEYSSDTFLQLLCKSYCSRWSIDRTGDHLTDDEDKTIVEFFRHCYESEALSSRHVCTSAPPHKGAYWVVPWYHQGMVRRTAVYLDKLPELVAIKDNCLYALGQSVCYLARYCDTYGMIVGPLHESKFQSAEWFQSLSLKELLLCLFTFIGSDFYLTGPMRHWNELAISYGHSLCFLLDRYIAKGDCSILVLLNRKIDKKVVDLFPQIEWSKAWMVDFAGIYSSLLVDINKKLAPEWLSALLLSELGILFPLDLIKMVFSYMLFS